MSTEELTPEQKMAVAVAKAKEARKKAKDEAKLALLDNADYVGFLARVEEESDDVKALQAKLDTLNKIKAIVAEDGTEYKVNAYPVAEYLFGAVMSRVLGLIVASSAMFTDERQAEFEAVTGVRYLTAMKARDAIGSPAYYSKGQLVEAIPGNGMKKENVVMSILVDLDIDIEYRSKLSQLDKWFETSYNKAKKKFDEFKKTESIDDTKFVLED